MSHDNIKNENPFRVPENYFDDFPLRMQEKIGEEQEKYSVIKGIYSFLKPQLALAVSIIGFALIAFIFVKTLVNPHQNLTYSLAEINEIVSSESLLYEEDILIMALREEDYLDGDVNETNDNYENEVIDYLMEEGVDLNHILEEL